MALVDTDLPLLMMNFQISGSSEPLFEFRTISSNTTISINKTALFHISMFGQAF